MDNEGAIESVRIKRVEFRENVRAFFPQEQTKTVRNNEVSTLSRCLKQGLTVGVHHLGIK